MRPTPLTVDRFQRAPTGSVTIRLPSSDRRLALILNAIVTLITLGAVVQAVQAGVSDVVVAGLIAVDLALAVVMFRQGSASLTIGLDEVTVRNPLRTFRFARSDVLGVSLARTPVLGIALGALETRPGRRVPVYALMLGYPRTPDGDQESLRSLRRVEEILDDQGDPSSPEM